MDREVIKNELPPHTGGGLANKADTEYSLDFISSGSLEEIESGIRETQKGLTAANLAIAVAIARIDKDALYVQAGFDSYNEYRENSEDRLNLPKQTISDYKRIGESYLKYKSRLQLTGFQEEGNLHKLRYIDRALEHHDADEVFNKLNTESLRRFISYATGPNRPVEKDPGYNLNVELTETEIKINGHNILQLDPDLDTQTRDELTNILKSIYTIKSTGNDFLLVDVYDEGEKRAIQNFLKKHRAKK